VKTRRAGVTKGLLRYYLTDERVPLRDGVTSDVVKVEGEDLATPGPLP